MSEREELVRRELDELRAAFEATLVAAAPLGAVRLDLDHETLSATALELVRRGDLIPLRKLLFDAPLRAGALLEHDDFEAELGSLVDKLTCLAAAFLAYEVAEWLERTIQALAAIYNLGLDERGASLDFALSIPGNEKRPRLWLLVIERVFALGALATRLRRWEALRLLTLTRPDALDVYYASWLRHALTMAMRAGHLEEDQEGQGVKLNLLSLARRHIERLPCLRVDGLQPDDELALTSLAQFDLLAGLVAIGAARSAKPGVFYPNFAQFRNERVEPIVVRLLSDGRMRHALFPLPDAELASALGASSAVEGW